MTGFKLRYHIHFHLQVFNLGIYGPVKMPVTGIFFKYYNVFVSQQKIEPVNQGERKFMCRATRNQIYKNKDHS